MNTEESLDYVDNKKIYDQSLFKIEQPHSKASIIHRSIAAITFITNHKQNAVGSAVLISQNLALTAAHNIYDKSQKCQNQNFKFYLNTHGIATNPIQIQSWRYLPQFKICKNKHRLEFDYALIKLKNNIPHDNFLHLTTPCETCLLKNNKDITLEIYGYPVYEQNFKSIDKDGDQIVLYQYGLSRKNRIVGIRNKLFRMQYAITTEQGQSGCPIVANNEIIALHNGAAKQNYSYNIGRLFTIDLIANITRWCGELKGSLFRVNDKDRCFHMESQLLQSTFVESKIDITNHINVAISLESYGKNYLEEGNYQMALQNYLKSLQIRQALKSTERIGAGKVLKKIGKVYKRMKNYPMALKSYLKSLEIQESVKGVGNVSTAKTLNNIGLIYYEQSQYTKALQTYAMSLKIYQLTETNNHIGLAQTHNNIGMVYQKINEPQKALQNYFLSLEIKNKVKGKQSVDSASTLNNIGIIYKRLSNFKKALQYYKQAIQICRNHQIGNKDYADYLANQGCCQYQLKEYQSAIRSLEQSSAIYEKIKNYKKKQKTSELLKKCFRSLLIGENE